MLFPLISIIVPVYNTEIYLEECINSIINQTYSGFELILVDDGSKDNSWDICRKFACKDKRIKVLHQENKGVTAARLLGLESSKGKYVCFVDSDDMLTEDALSVLLDKIVDDADIVTTWEPIEQTITGREYVSKLLEKRTTLALWGKLYRKELIISSRAMEIPRDIYIGEDQLANIKMALLAKKIVCTPAAIYIYRDNVQSVWRTRKWSLEYEYMFRNEIKNALGTQIDVYRESWYKFQLNILYDLILHNIKFSYKEEWIRDLLLQKCNYNLSMRERVVYFIHNRFLCRLIFFVGYKVRKVVFVLRVKR